MLSGGDQADLKKYLNSQVEIRGTLQGGNRTGSSATGSGTGSASGTGSGSGTGTGSSASGTGSSQSGMQTAPTLRVTSVKQIAPSCSSENR
jgi:hypothetical protein